MAKKIHSFYDAKDKLFVDCSECERGGNGNAKDRCSCGFKVKRHNGLGCFMGDLIEGIIIQKP